MKLYKSTMTGFIVNEKELSIVINFTGMIFDYVEMHDIDVIDILKCHAEYPRAGRFSLAVEFYMSLHENATYKEARRMVKRIQTDMIRFDREKKVAEYCDNDVIATEAVFNQRMMNNGL